LKRLGWDSVEVTYDDVTKRAGRTGAELRELYHHRAAATAATALDGHRGPAGRGGHPGQNTGVSHQPQ
jgi:hypothetical protein